MSKLLIDVTQDDIERGAPADSNQCAFARAAERALNCAVAVLPSLLVIEQGPHEGRSWTLPSDARRFIADYDSGHPVQPSTFELEDDRR